MGFMAGFGRGISEGLERNAQRKAKREDALLSTRLKLLMDNNANLAKAKSAEAANIKKAKALSDMIPGAPEGIWKDLFHKVSAGVSDNKILDFYKDVDYIKDAPKPEVPTPTVEAQTDEALHVAPTDPTVDVSKPKPPKLGLVDHLNQRSNERMAVNVDNAAKDVMGEEAFNAAQQPFEAADIGTSGYTAKSKPEKEDEVKTPTSFEQVAVLALQSTSGWENKTPEEKQELAAAAKQLLNASTKGEGASTLTDGVLASNIAKYTMMMGSSVPEEVATAEAWFATEYLAIKSALEQVKALGKTDTPKAPPKLKVKVQDGEGKTRVVEATLADGGTYISVATGKPVEGTVIYAQSSDTFGEMTKATTATIGLRTDYTDQRTATITVAKAGLELDKIAEANELALSSVTGKGVSFFQSSKQELLNIISLVGDKGTSQEDGNGVTAGRLIQDVASYVNNQSKNGMYTKEQADQIKLFAAASVRYIFAAGKALGQQGNGFSNQDYKVIRDSIINSNSIEAFSENLRKFSRERFDEMASHTKTITQNGSIINALDLGAPIEFDIMGVEEYMGKVPGFEGVWAWANSSVGDIDPSTLAELNK